MGKHDQPAGSVADFLARLDRQVEQAHQDIATTYTSARRAAFAAHSQTRNADVMHM